MRAIVVELTGPTPALIEGTARAALDEGEGTDSLPTTDADDGAAATRATGALAEREIKRDEYDVAEGEPW